MKEIELYIHIPFCVRKCNYCDFLSFPANEKIQNIYVQALLKEIETVSFRMQTDENREAVVRSIFIGGGTPSILSIKNMSELLKMTKESFSCKENAEISMEANPGTLSAEKLSAYHEMGINRLSIGLQTSEDECLKKLGRIHTFDQFCKNYDQARRAGFDNINVDLMSALPGQTLSSYKNTLETVMQLQPEHISSYSLILEEGTPFYEDDKLIALLPDEETERLMYEETRLILQKNGYERYEISNYARKGYECLHNLGYWEDIPYLGFGLGASSYWKENGEAVRFCNSSDMDDYIVSPYRPLEEREEYQLLSLKDKMEEYMFLGLRKIQGVSIAQFECKFGRSMDSVYGSVIEKYVNLGLLYRRKDQLSLTDAGINVSNRIFCDFLL